MYLEFASSDVTDVEELEGISSPMEGKAADGSDHCNRHGSDEKSLGSRLKSHSEFLCK